ncbi:signal recognition particle-docking protein FtsY, partial [Pseudonocardia lutea]
MTTQTLWIIVVVVAVVVLIALVAGLTVSRRRRISLRERDELETPAAEERPRQGNTYQATGGFDFSAGSGAATGTPKLPPRPEPGPDLLAPPREKEPEPRRRGGAA